MKTLPHNSRHFAPRKTGDATPLGALERAVMAVVWARPERITVGEVRTALRDAGPVAYTTVKTTMERLAEKGILARTRVGKAYVYQAMLSQDELERQIVTGALERLIEQFPQAVASFLVSPDDAVPDAQVALLREAIARQSEMSER